MLPVPLTALLTLLPVLAAAAKLVTPPAAQVIDQKGFNNLVDIAPQNEQDGNFVFYPPGTTAGSLSARPFHIYDESFIKLLGDNPSLTLLSETDSDPLFHEAAVWHPPTDSMFFVQNAGAPAAGTGLNKSSIVERIMLSDAEAAAAAAATGGPGKSGSNSSAQIDVEVVDSQPQVINPNGGTNWRGQIVFAGEGMGNKTASALYAMDPVEYNTTVLLNNYMGRQFNSLNDVAVHPNGWIYFTDVDYGALQDFRAKVNIRKQVYRFNPDSGVVQAVSDSTPRPNGITFSPDGNTMYVADTGAAEGFYGMDWTKPASIYKYPVNKDGTVGPASLFAFCTPGVPDGVHCDTKGNVYAGIGDGVHVWNSAGTFLGKIYTGGTVANFAFAGKGRMVILSETKLWYATLGAEGAHIPGLEA